MNRSIYQSPQRSNHFEHIQPNNDTGNISTRPKVSVVTPFFNTAEYLPECIESVLAQTYVNFEYILVNNCSTDDSWAIAKHYAGQDERVRLVSSPIFRDQVENYNYALQQIASDSRYVKVVQADDAIYPTCLEKMVDVAERDSRIGLVSSYKQHDNGAQFPVKVPSGSSIFSGVAIAQVHLRGDYYLFGNPTALMYRADLVRNDDAFYDTACFAEDTDVCYRILQTEYFGFVHDLLTFKRTENDSISRRMRKYKPHYMRSYLFAKKYAHIYFEEPTAKVLIDERKDNYYRYLGASLLRFRGPDFWIFHQKGLATIGEKIKWSCVLSYASVGTGRLVLKRLKIMVNSMVEARLSTSSNDDFPS